MSNFCFRNDSEKQLKTCSRRTRIQRQKKIKSKKRKCKWIVEANIFVLIETIIELILLFCSDPIKAAELAFERAAEAAARAAAQEETEEEVDSGPKPILPYSSFFILSSTNP